MSDEKPLNHAPWNSLTESEKAAWDRAAVKNGPRFFGGARLTAVGFHHSVTTLTARQKAAEERRKYRY